MRTYASESSISDALLDRELTDDGADLAGLAALASRLVDRACRRAVYDTTPAGLPADAVVAEAFEAAVVEQVAYWVAEDIDPTRGPSGVPQNAAVTEAKLSTGSAKIHSTAPVVTAARLDSLHALVPAAWAWLEDVLRGTGPGVPTRWRI